METEKNIKPNNSLNNNEFYQVGDLAAMSGKTVRALRLYEEKGLLHPASRTQGGFRLYDEQSVVRLKWILQMQRLGFTLSQISELAKKLDVSETAPLAMIETRRLFLDKLGEVKEKISEMQKLADELESALEYLTICKGCTAKRKFADCCLPGLLNKETPGDKLPNILSGLFTPYLRKIQKVEEIKKEVKQ